MTTSAPAVVAPIKRSRGRPSLHIVNPFEGLIGQSTAFGQYPYFASDIIEGIARLDWHDRPIGIGGSSKPLSVKRLFGILSCLPVITAATVQEFLGLGLRQSQRYVKAIELAMPRLVKASPACLIAAMNGDFYIAGESPWTDTLEPPSTEALRKLHHDLRDL